MPSSKPSYFLQWLISKSLLLLALSVAISTPKHLDYLASLAGPGTKLHFAPSAPPPEQQGQVSAGSYGNGLLNTVAGIVIIVWLFAIFPLVSISLGLFTLGINSDLFAPSPWRRSDNFDSSLNVKKKLNPILRDIKLMENRFENNSPSPTSQKNNGKYGKNPVVIRKVYEIPSDFKYLQDLLKSS